MSARRVRAVPWRWYAAAALSVIGLAVSASSASAGMQPGNSYWENVQGGEAPSAFTTNIPYVAWRGEEIRAVKCTEDLLPWLDGVDGKSPLRLKQGNSLDVLVESWSGSNPGPQLESSTVDTFFWSRQLDLPCVRFDMVSSDAGLARVKLVVSDSDHNPIVKHQFLMIWLTLGNVAIDEVGNNDPSGGQPAGSDAAVGDPAGDGNLTAGSADGRIDVHVTGTFPHPLAPGGTFTLPNDWATIAGALATDNNPLDTNPAQQWDIHDGQGQEEGHVSGFCKTGVSPTAPPDAVDNCNGSNSDLGPFSNVFGQGVTAAGPFDPARPATLLANGNLDANDAPMPATRVDVSIAPNSGKAGDISGTGALEPTWKADVYSRDGNGGGSAHNLYAPYYEQFIPATSATDYGVSQASGIDGPAQGNNFVGFLFDGLYKNWQTYSLRSTQGVATQCDNQVGDPRYTPSGDQSVAVYTDEHGEAQVSYKPYAGGFYYDSLPVVLNRNGGCDLQGITTLGTASISAVARYPYQPVDANPVSTGTISKTVTNLFDKSLSYWPKGTGAANNNARIVVAHANDVDGSPYAGEKVCFYIAEQADGFQGYTGDAGPLNAPFQVWGGPAKTEQGADICRTLDKNGNAAIEVFNSDPQVINVIANYVCEGLLRSIDVDFSQSGSSGGHVPGAAPQPTSAAGSGTPSASQINTQGAAAGVLSQAVKHKSAKKKARRISVAHIALRGGKRVLLVRVISTHKTEWIKIKVGKRTYRRHVRTNHLVKVANVTLPKAGSVKVTLG